MLSKQVKHRISLNKYRHRVPKWRQDMNWHFSSETSLLEQRRLSSKHFIDARQTIRYLDRQLAELNKAWAEAEHWSRHDWRKYEADHRAKRKAEWTHLRQLAKSSQLNEQSLGRAVRPLDMYGSPDDYKKIPVDTTPGEDDVPNLTGQETLDLTGNADPKQLLDLVNAHPNANWVTAFVPDDAKKQGERK